jgi:hypothetical protein
MFDPNPADVRRFFCEAWRKRRDDLSLTPLEALAADWIGRHPEYHDDFADAERAVAAFYPPEAGRTNPFLHLSLHLSIAEQVGIDQPKGIRRAWQTLAARTGSEHEAAHVLIECLAETLWEAQRHGRPLDQQAYTRMIARAAGLPADDDGPSR